MHFHCSLHRAFWHGGLSCKYILKSATDAHKTTPPENKRTTPPHCAAHMRFVSLQSRINSIDIFYMMERTMSIRKPVDCIRRIKFDKNGEIVWRIVESQAAAVMSS